MIVVFCCLSFHLALILALSFRRNSFSVVCLETISEKKTTTKWNTKWRQEKKKLKRIPIKWNKLRRARANVCCFFWSFFGLFVECRRRCLKSRRSCDLLLNLNWWQRQRWFRCRFLFFSHQFSSSVSSSVRFLFVCRINGHRRLSFENYLMINLLFCGNYNLIISAFSFLNVGFLLLRLMRSNCVRIHFFSRRFFSF